MGGWLLVLTLINLILADAIVWLMVAMGWLLLLPTLAAAGPTRWPLRAAGDWIQGAISFHFDRKFRG
jgi:hypothetical protein